MSVRFEAARRAWIDAHPGGQEALRLGAALGSTACGEAPYLPRVRCALEIHDVLDLDWESAWDFSRMFDDVGPDVALEWLGAGWTSGTAAWRAREVMKTPEAAQDLLDKRGQTIGDVETWHELMRESYPWGDAGEQPVALELVGAAREISTKT